MAYKNNPLDDIVKCDIEISSPASSDATFDTILLIVNGPSEEKDKKMEKTTAISKADELLDYGFTVDDIAYRAATAAFSQNPSPDELYICIRKIVEETETYEDITETLIRANSEAGFYGVHITEFNENTTDLEKAIAWVEANEKMLAFDYCDYDSFPLKNTSYYRSFGMYGGNADGYTDGVQPEENKYEALSLMAKCFGYEPGSETWHMKELSTFVPSALSTDQKKGLEANNITSFLRYGGCNVSIGGKMLAGEWIDVIRFRDWLKNEIQINVFNVIKTNRKVPFTDPGIRLIQGAVRATLKKGQEVGGIAETEFDDNDNPIYGYSITVPKSSDLTEAERKSRKLPKCKWTARLAGAIHVVEVSGFLTF